MKDLPPNADSPPPPDPLAVALSKLDPAPHGFNRDALMFAAGQASKWRLVTLWRAIAVIAIVVAALFATLYFTQPKSSASTVWPASSRR